MRSLVDAQVKRNIVPPGLVTAGVFGTIHAGFSLFWAAGGTWLLWTVGSSLQESFHGRERLLYFVGGLKLVAALGPVMLAYAGWPFSRVTRGVSWLGALVLIVWGGINTITGNLVLAGVINPQHGYDRLGMIGHAYLWDPLFLVWGIALVVGLLATRSSRENDALQWSSSQLR